jgi:hypothetical protein
MSFAYLQNGRRVLGSYRQAQKHAQAELTLARELGHSTISIGITRLLSRGHRAGLLSYRDGREAGSDGLV